MNNLIELQKRIATKANGLDTKTTLRINKDNSITLVVSTYRNGRPRIASVCVRGDSTNDSILAELAI